jgi:hypothetical protein
MVSLLKVAEEFEMTTFQERLALVDETDLVRIIEGAAEHACCMCDRDRFFVRCTAERIEATVWCWPRTKQFQKERNLRRLEDDLSEVRRGRDLQASNLKVAEDEISQLEQHIESLRVTTQTA